MNRVSLIRFILGKSWVGQLINQKDNDGNTPLHLLVASDCKVYELWMHHRADHDAFDGKNMTPVDLVWSSFKEARMSTFAATYVMGVISENSVILMCKFGSRTVPIKCCRSFTSYMDLVDKLCFKFSVLRFDSVRLFYNLRDYDGCVLANDDDLEVMFSLVGCFGVEVIDVTVVNSIGSSGCFGRVCVAFGVDRCDICFLTTFVGSDGLCGGSSGSYGSIFTSSKGKGSGVSCLSTDVGSVGLCGGSSGSYGSIFTSSKGKGSGVSCFGDVVASGVSGSSGSSDGLCSDVGSCSSSKGKGLAVIRSQWSFAKNETDRVTAFCKDADCKWRVYARLDKVSRHFYIRSFDDIHSCGASVLSTKHSRASSSMIGRLMSADIRTTPQKRPIDVVSSLKGLYGVDVPYKRAWKGVEKGRSEAFGDYDASFDELRWYREAVKNSDPESVFDIEVDTETNRFKRLFVAFSACIYGFKHLRPLLFVDGTFLKGNFKGSLLSAVRRMVIKFLRVFPSGFHGYCLYHLKNNLRGRLTGGRNKYKERVIGLFSLCAYAPNEMKFNEEMARLKKAGGESRITNFLADLPYEHWANAFFPGQRYGEMWSNLAECFNSWIEKERHLPITQLVDRVRIKLMEQMCCRKQIAAKWRQVLCPTMDEALRIAFQESKAWEVKFSSPDVLEVLCNPSVKVDIGRHSCTCTQWQLNGVPCVHAVCAIKKSGKSLNACVERYFHVECYGEAYSRPIMPVPTLWKLEGAGDAVILPPFSRKPPGRNKKKRIRSFGEKVRTIKCTRCGKRGSHNRRSCKEAIN
ncbi:hypothetical protein RHMOL_Rhmol04G0315700 [Rhododendron molle]|uniref:Uncharacterized protein n=1 Tax=Rhododendron molle TaxID=49168 RepID=A0ACC0P664_RHOML|nr:hypothetical protein RHMOL_Rhmol04G0315700 [Rhododendron molle]